MDDEFLYRFRRQPPREFARGLKAKLDRQATARLSLRSSFGRGLAVALVLGGTALAITTVSIQDGRFTLFDSSQTPERGLGATTGAEASEDRPADESQTPSDQRASGAAPSPAQGGGSQAVTAAPTASSAVVETRGGSLRQRSSAATARREARSPPAAALGGARNIRIIGPEDTRPYIETAGANFTASFEVVSAGEALTKLCFGTGATGPDILATFDRADPGASAQCPRLKFWGEKIVEIKLGYEAVVLARSVIYGSMPALSPRDVFLALAKELPNREEDPETLIQNPYRAWNEVNPVLDPDPIQAIHPPEDYAYDDAVLAPALDAGCNSFAWIAALKISRETRHRQICRTLREDGVYQENANPISHMETYPTVIGVLSYRAYERNKSKVVAMSLGGVAPTLESIRAGTYPASRALYLYVKTPESVFGVRRLVEEYLRYQLLTTLIPSDEAELAEMLARAASLGPIGLPR
jgi:phosphate transport system substrate-binding protein